MFTTNFILLLLKNTIIKPHRKISREPVANLTACQDLTNLEFKIIFSGKIKIKVPLPSHKMHIIIKLREDNIKLTVSFSSFYSATYQINK